MAETTRTGLASADRVARSSQALLVVDEDAVTREASLGACRLLGLARAEVVGRPVEDLLEPGSRERFGHVWQAFRESGGHADPFGLDSPAAGVEVGITVTAGVLPERHLIRFDTATDSAEPEGTEANHVDATEAAPRVTEPAGPRAPTAREREVLALLAGGATDGQIATMLELSPATVQTHVRNAKAKLGAKTRAQAVALAIQRSLITPR